MNRLQKKCLIVSASCHGLLLLVLVVGPAFFIPRDKVESVSLITVISGPVVDKATSSSGTPNIQEPPPAAPNLPPAVEPPKTDPPKVVETVKPPPQPKPVEPVKPSPPKPDDFTVVKAQRIEPPKPPADEFQPVSHPIKKPPQANPNSYAIKKPTDTKAPQSRDNNQNIADALGKIRGIGQTLSPGVKIDAGPHGGDSDADVSNYADIVYSKYYYAWTPPTSMLKNTGLVTVRVTIARNGRVTHSEIASRSGDATMDRSIQNTLDNVTIIEPFPANSRDVERSYTIEFDLAAKRSL